MGRRPTASSERQLCFRIPKTSSCNSPLLLTTAVVTIKALKVTWFLNIKFRPTLHLLYFVGLEILRKHICLDAAYDATNVNKPGCSPGTRTEIQNALAHWMNDPNPEHRLLWLHGPAGAGKSAIAQSAMQQAAKDKRLGASFFFSHGAPGRSNADRLFPTIAYQITRNIPTLEKPVKTIMRTNPELMSKTLTIQFKELIDRPARESNIPLDYPVIGIDGIDECENEVVQEAFITDIGDAVISQCPFRFIISSRPEPHLRRLFSERFHAYTREIVLETSAEAFNDVNAYLRTGFAEICERRRNYMQHVPQPWPSNDDLRELSRRSSGHFIFAVTVLKFVGGDRYQNPVNQLNIILRPTAKMKKALKTSPYSELDHLYLQVLSTHPDPSQLVQILQFFLSYREPFAPPTRLLDDLLNIERGTVATSLSGMHSLIDFKDFDSDGYTSTFHHASFEDFLLDASRSHHFHIDIERAFDKVKTACVDLLIRWVNEANRLVFLTTTV